jgi:hypothetical protein
MNLLKKVFVLTPVFILVSVINCLAGNPVDSDLSNRAGSNSGNSHLDIYIFIIVLLVVCVIVPFIEDKNKKRASN